MPRTCAVVITAILLIPPQAGAAKVKTDENFKTGIALLKKGENEAALKSLQKVKAKRNSQLSHNTSYMKAISLIALDKKEEALDELHKAAGNKIIGDWALLHLAEMAEEKGDYQELVRITDRFIVGYPYSPLFERMVLYKAKGLVKTGKVKESISVMENHLVQKRNVSEEILWEFAQNMEIVGESEDAYRTYQKIFYFYPHLPISEKARLETVRMQKEYPGGFPTAEFWMKYKRVKTLMKNGMYMDAEKYINSLKRQGKLDKRQVSRLELQKAICLKRQRKKDQAVAQYRRIVTAKPRSRERPEAMYNLARLLWNMGKDEKAKRILLSLEKDYPNHPRTALAYYIVGRIEEGRKNYGVAVESYTQAIKYFHDTDTAEDCMWHIAWLYYELGEYDLSHKAFNNYLNSYPYSDDLAKVLYWQARIMEKQNMDPTRYYKMLQRKFPFSYYTLSAPTGFEKPIFEQKAMPHPEGYKLREIVGERMKKSITKKKYRPKLVKRDKWYLAAAENWQVLGYHERGEELIDRIAKHLNDTVSNNIWLSYQYYLLNDYNAVMRQFWKLWGEHPNSPEEREIVKILMFPLSNWEVILAQSKEYDIDPFLVLSIIRQESSFDPASISPANARGLMQIMPSTGRKLSRALNVENFSIERLHEPEMNIKMGTYYLAHLLRDNGGDIVPAVASYNAGKKTVSKWFKRFPYDNVEEFIEKIPYPETRGYVKKVLRNYGVYRSMYEEHFGLSAVSAR
jgi:tetratricopeptide (TPR) repeat protein